MRCAYDSRKREILHLKKSILTTALIIFFIVAFILHKQITGVFGLLCVWFAIYREEYASRMTFIVILLFYPWIESHSTSRHVIPLQTTFAIYRTHRWGIDVNEFMKIWAKTILKFYLHLRETIVCTSHRCQLCRWWGRTLLPLSFPPWRSQRTVCHPGINKEQIKP